MPVYATEEVDRMVAVDAVHRDMLTALVACLKPHRVLEIGFGTGTSCKGILNALRWNQQPVHYDLVDNWYDWKGQRPPETEKPEYKGVNFITSTEEDFVHGEQREPYDFILSDGDHFRAQEWSGHVYENLLKPDGILVYHDVTNMRRFPRLIRIYEEAIRRGWHHKLFANTSRKDEFCDRGLLVIFKH